MANYYGKCRTNYAKFNLDKLKAVLAQIAELGTQTIYVFIDYAVDGDKKKEIALAHIAKNGGDETEWYKTVNQLFPGEQMDNFNIPEEVLPHLKGIGFGFEDGYPYLQDEDGNEFGDFAELVSECLEDDSILIFMENGYEKMRYLTGSACAYNNKGETCAVNINDIYELAEQKLGVSRADITRAEY